MAAFDSTPLVRREDWPLRLNAVIDFARSAPFGYAPGQQHCCQFTGDAVLAMTGRDPMAWFRGKYDSEVRAYAALRRFAGGELAEAMEKIASQCCLAEIRPIQAGRGDVVLHDTPDGHALGVCVGATFATVCRPGGLAFIPMTSALRAWRI